MTMKWEDIPEADKDTLVTWFSENFKKDMDKIHADTKIQWETWSHETKFKLGMHLLVQLGFFGLEFLHDDIAAYACYSYLIEKLLLVLAQQEIIDEYERRLASDQKELEKLYKQE